MSALSIMSVPTPAIQAAPQGATSTVVSGFEGLLAAMFQMAEADETVAKPAVTAEVDADKVIGFLAAPPSVAPQADVVAAPEAPVTTAPPPVPAEPAPPSEAAPAAAAPVASDAAEIEAPTVETPDDASTGASLPTGEELEAAVTAGKAAETAAQVKAVTQAPPAPAVQPTAPTLRPLAERTSKPLEEGAKETVASPDAGKGVSSIDIAPAAGSATDVAPAASPSDAPVPVVGAEAAPVDAVQVGEGDAAAPQAQTVHAARDANPSTMSRVAVEATAQIAAQISRRLEGRSTRFEMSLLPEELGRVDVKLEIGADGRLAARLAFDNPLAATDLRGRADELRRELEAQGFQMADDAFEFTERDSGSHAFDRGQDSRSGHGRAFSSAARLNAEADVVQPRWTQLSLSPTGVDLKV
ncbi:flagellar hook-length control protein FliK [Brevundimonas sp. NPDC092305]|uniref:flagellar hook-length control protein FliK n=1 Tax=Brevundimonas sp. NPDC092305 TaxID=3363957 RepID=UPI00382073A0